MEATTFGLVFWVYNGFKGIVRPNKGESNGKGKGKLNGK